MYRRAPYANDARCRTACDKLERAVATALQAGNIKYPLCKEIEATTREIYEY